MKNVKKASGVATYLRRERADRPLEDFDRIWLDLLFLTLERDELRGELEMERPLERLGFACLTRDPERDDLDTDEPDLFFLNESVRFCFREELTALRADEVLRLVPRIAFLFCALPYPDPLKDPRAFVLFRVADRRDSLLLRIVFDVLLALVRFLFAVPGEATDEAFRAGFFIFRFPERFKLLDEFIFRS